MENYLTLYLNKVEFDDKNPEKPNIEFNFLNVLETKMDIIKKYNIKKFFRYLKNNCEEYSNTNIKHIVNNKIEFINENENKNKFYTNIDNLINGILNKNENNNETENKNNITEEVYKFYEIFKDYENKILKLKNEENEENEENKENKENKEYLTKYSESLKGLVGNYFKEGNGKKILNEIQNKIDALVLIYNYLCEYIKNEDENEKFDVTKYIKNSKCSEDVKNKANEILNDINTKKDSPGFVNEFDLVKNKITGVRYQYMWILREIEEKFNYKPIKDLIKKIEDNIKIDELEPDNENDEVISEGSYVNDRD